ncbi:hypothetical protein L873DRAFT_1840425 [Choiromyces venosus 120613-1]|uniref:Transposase Tc1-like domain-containing protein n=1 Tax=Choiromyces venosus 120613-1 TaxID=1336337 RepID=A0A3N4K7A7_9PEZI|nr:hypothetical protein L873DRAFT_1840425 [Choiromyces venosus 120613-1]
MHVLGLPYHAIQTRTGVATSTANNIYLRAVKNATALAAERQKQTPLEVQKLGPGVLGELDLEVEVLGPLGGYERWPGASGREDLGVGIPGLMGIGESAPGVPEVEDLGVLVPGLLGHLENCQGDSDVEGLAVRIPGLLQGLDGGSEVSGEEGGSSEVEIPGLQGVQNGVQEVLGAEVRSDIGASHSGGSENTVSEADCWGFGMLRLESNAETIRESAKFSFLDLISEKSIDSKPHSGRPAALLTEEKDALVEFIKQDFTTCRMRLVDIRRESGLSHVSDTTVWKALREQGIKAYREEFKFILKSENKLQRLTYCEERKDWTLNEWRNYGFTDEMSIEIGSLFGLNLIWQDITERWHEDCVGAMKKQGISVMCWGMIGWGWKGPFHVWEMETKQEREEAATAIAILEAKRVAEENELNTLWKASDEWKHLKLTEQIAYRLQRRAEKSENIPKKRIPQTWRGKKYKIERYKRGDGKGVDSW